MRSFLNADSDWHLFTLALSNHLLVQSLEAFMPFVNVDLSR